jgi:glycosyltransferase involved in cell wall biosynthesis
MESKHPKIKILFSIPNFDTAGSGKALLKVATGLDASKFEPHIMCLHGKGTFFNVVKASGIPIHIVPYTTPMKPYSRGLWNCYKISRLLKAIKPTIIHSFHYGADYSEPLAAKMAGIKWMYTKKSMSWGGKSKNAWGIRSYLALAIVIQNTDMKKLFFPKPRRTVLIPRGVDTNEFKPKENKREFMDKWSMLNHKRIIICVANLVPVKGIDILIRAFGEICKDYEDWRMIIVGDDTSDYAKEQKQLAGSLKMEGKVVFTGKEQTIVEFLNMAEVFVLPTLNEGRKEGSPVALLEAMACEKYVLASNVPGVRDQLEGFKGHLFEAGSIEGLRKKLTEIASLSPEEITLKGRVFRKHVLDNYTIEHEVDKTEKLYLNL